MNNDELEEHMRALEYFHSLRVLPGAWVVIRVEEYLPMKEAYAAYLREIMSNQSASAG
jgi:hypothetical protein